MKPELAASCIPSQIIFYVTVSHLFSLPSASVISVSCRVSLLSQQELDNAFVEILVTEDFRKIILPSQGALYTNFQVHL